MRKIIQLYFLLFFSFAFSQTELVFVYFKDKPNASIFLSNPLSELTQKSINRRTNLKIPITEQDAPIESTYIQNIENLGHRCIFKNSCCRFLVNLSDNFICLLH